MCSLCGLPVAKNHNFGQILTFFGLLYQPPFTERTQTWCAITDPWSTLTCQISSRSVYSVVLWRRKTPIFAVFWTSAFSGVGNWQQSGKAEDGAQLQTFPYTTVPKPFLCSNAFMAKSGAQSLTFKSVTDRQTYIHTYIHTKKTQRFWPPRRRVKSEPHQTWHGDNLQHFLAPRKLLRV